ncbi:MAG: ribosome small subunit-dependent GTPase A [Candidatus Obscuribacterales bacterium]|nr:ribosome small subunit-dependent GTPase A [Candidatus Obscuribacterales bacterium]
MDRNKLGWSPSLDQHGERSEYESLVRIIARHKAFWQGLTVSGNRLNCHLSGKMSHEAFTGAQLPAVGDWCATGASFLDETNNSAAVVKAVLPRRSVVARMVAGVDADEQVLAANVDYAFLVTSANKNFNVNRLRRYMILANHGGAQPVVVLSKVDLADGAERDFVDRLQAAFPDVRYVLSSALSLTGVERIESILREGKTGVFLGSSGVGKSTLVNLLLGREAQRTGEIRENDAKGRHTTSGAGLFFMPKGGMIIDTPGLREVHVLGAEADLDRLMPSFSELAATCKFGNCTHNTEPGCQVQKALADERLSRGELDCYLKLNKELAYARRKLDKRAAIQEHVRWKKVAAQQRQLSKERGRF